MHDANAPATGNLLDRMQSWYNNALDWCVKHPRITILASVIPLFIAGGIYLLGVKQKFFPAAERNQFVIELWMPSLSNVDVTAAGIKKLEALIQNDERVETYSSFIGNSAPRFYYNYSPEFPVTNYGQIVVNTVDIKAADELAAELVNKVENAVPQGRAQVRLMQQGQPLKSPIEIQISGDDLPVLKSLGDQVDSIIRSYPEARLITNNFREDYVGVDLKLKPSAERMGFTTEVVAKSVYAGLKGVPITFIHEGNKVVNVVFKTNNPTEDRINNLDELYITSPITQASVPFSQIASLEPVWKTGNVMHLNGIRTLTVMADVDHHYLPSELFNKIKPVIEQLPLPNGYFIQFAGEYGNQKSVLGDMILALAVSLLLIFFTLLFQFKNLREALLIMTTIPLSIFGAMVGLWVTGNNFGFTAFVGLISLSGVVVRNAIILIDHIHELVNHHQMDWRAAAIESGKRRLRPIFLTAMAAAIGVLPMIISGSPMWSPLASVIAFGVIWSMFIALLSIPVIYLKWVSPSKK